MKDLKESERSYLEELLSREESKPMLERLRSGKLKPTLKEVKLDGK